MTPITQNQGATMRSKRRSRRRDWGHRSVPLSAGLTDLAGSALVPFGVDYATPSRGIHRKATRGLRLAHFLARASGRRKHQKYA